MPIHSRSSLALKGISSILTKMFSFQLNSKYSSKRDCSPKLLTIEGRSMALACSSFTTCLIECRASAPTSLISSPSYSRLFSTSQLSEESFRSSQQRRKSRILGWCWSQTLLAMKRSMRTSELRVAARMEREQSLMLASMKQRLKLLRAWRLRRARNCSETMWQGASPSMTALRLPALRGALSRWQQLMQPEMRGCIRLKQRILQLMVPSNRSMPRMRSQRMPKIRYLLSQFSMQNSCRGCPATSTYCTSTFVVTTSVYPTNCPWITQPSIGTDLMTFSSSLMSTTFSRQSTQPISPREVHTTSMMMSLQSRRRPRLRQTSQSSRSEWTWMLFEKRSRFSERQSTTQQLRKGVSNIFCTLILSCREQSSPATLTQGRSSSRQQEQSSTGVSLSTVTVCRSSCRIISRGCRLLWGPRKWKACPEYSLRLSMQSLPPERQMLESTRQRTMLSRQQVTMILYLSFWPGTPFTMLTGNSSRKANLGRKSILRILRPWYSRTLSRESLVSGSFRRRLRRRPSMQRKLLWKQASLRALGTRDSKEWTYWGLMTGQQMRGQQSTMQSRTPGWKQMKFENSWLRISKWGSTWHLLMQRRESSLALPMQRSLPSLGSRTFSKQKENSFTLPSRVSTRNRRDCASPEQWNQAIDVIRSFPTCLFRMFVFFSPSDDASYASTTPLLVPTSRYSASLENDRHTGSPDRSIAIPFSTVPDSASHTRKWLSLQRATSFPAPTARDTARTSAILNLAQWGMCPALTQSASRTEKRRCWSVAEKQSCPREWTAFSMKQGFLPWKASPTKVRVLSSREQTRIWLARVRMTSRASGLQLRMQLSVFRLCCRRGTENSFFTSPVYRFSSIIRSRLLVFVRQNSEEASGWKVKQRQLDSRTYLQSINNLNTPPMLTTLAEVSSARLK